MRACGSCPTNYDGCLSFLAPEHSNIEMREPSESAKKTCKCSHSFCVGEGEEYCQQLEDRTEDRAHELFADGPEEQGTVKATQSFFMGWQLKAKRNIAKGEVIGGAR